MALTKINSSVIANNTIAVGNIADNSVDATKIASNSILTRHIDDDQITGDQLADNITIAGTLTSTGAFTSPGIDDNADAVAITINSSEQVGIGTTSPAFRLHVLDTIGTRTLSLGHGVSSGTITTDSAKDLNFQQAGTTKMTLDSSGDIFAKTADARIGSDVGSVEYGTSTSNSVRFYSADTERMRITSAGSVGIGTTTPSQLLTVEGSSFPILQISNTDANNPANAVALDLVEKQTGYAAATATFGETGVYGYRLKLDGSSNDLILQSGSQTTVTNRITIERDTGNVGIGTTNPGGTLHVQTSHTSTDVTAANSNETLVLGNAGTGNGVYNAIKFGGNQQDMYIMSFNNNQQADRRLGFFLGSVAGDAVADERLSILGNGNVGINRTSPNGLFHMQSSSGTDSALYIQTSATSDDSIINFGDNGSSAIGKILYEHSSDSMRFNTGGAERVRIEDDPLLLITGGTNSTTFEHLTLKSTVDNNPSRVNQVFETGQGKIAKIEGRQIAGGSNAYGELNFFTSDNGTLAEKMAIKYDGVMKLMGGITGGRQDLLFNNGSMSLANNATYTLSGILNTGALISIGVNRSNQGITYDHCLIFAETGTNAVAVANPSGRIAINSSSTDNAVNVYVSSGNVVIANFVQSTVTVSIAAFVFQGN